jgi:hypothetical protein
MDGKRVVFLLGLILIVGCSVQNYRIERRNISCSEANGLAHDTLVRQDYEVTRFDPATEGTAGMIEARRDTAIERRSGKLKISCGTTTVFDPVEGQWYRPGKDKEFSRDMYYALLAGLDDRQRTRTGAVLDRGIRGPSARGEAGDAAGALLRTLTPLESAEAMRLVGLDLQHYGLLAVRVAVVNGTEQGYLLKTEEVVLFGEAGEVYPLRSSELAPRLLQAPAGDGEGRPKVSALDVPVMVETLSEQLLSSGLLAAGDARSGLLYFPAGHYDGGRVPLVNQKNKKTDEGMVQF